jgi:hypothetical protein
MRQVLSFFAKGLAGPLIVIVFSGALSAQQKPTFDPHDFSGFWDRVGYERGVGGKQAVGGCNICGDPGFGVDVPPMTPEGKKKFEANKPAYGRPAGGPLQAGVDIGRQRAVLSALSNDPTMKCQPLGVVRLLLSTYFGAMEFVQLPDRIIEHFEWTNEWREIWMDGREIPAEPDLTRWNGYSVGHWDGDTLVVNSFGHDERTWLDFFGYPHSDQMRLEERYRRIASDQIEFVMTVNDPAIYTKPWSSDKKVLRRLSAERETLSGWKALLDDRCEPEEEADFNRKVRDPAGGIAH